MNDHEIIEGVIHEFAGPSIRVRPTMKKASAIISSAVSMNWALPM